MNPELLWRVHDLRSQRMPFVYATVVRVHRPTSAKPGDSALLLPDGTLEGFVGGECAEATVRAHGLRLLGLGESTLLRIVPAGSPVPETAEEGTVTATNTCLSAGGLDIFLEVAIPQPLVYVFGDSPVAQALSTVAKALDYELISTTDPHEAIAADASAAIVASHGRDEATVLAAALKSDVPYVALVASHRRGEAVADELKLSEEDRKRLHTPAGLDIGARTPAEVALSILAELIATRPQNAGTEPNSKATAIIPATVVVDPICGMQVAVTASTLKLDHDGRSFYFCSSGCRDAFAAEPQRYVS